MVFVQKKSRIIDIFPKGLTNGFGPKMAIFPNFFFGQNRLGKCFLRYFTPKKLFSTLYKQQVLKVKKIDIFTKGLTHGFCPKMTILPTCFFKAI